MTEVCACTNSTKQHPYSEMQTCTDMNTYMHTCKLIIKGESSEEVQWIHMDRKKMRDG